MSKSADNYVGVLEPPLDQLRKLMQVDDDVIFRYFELLSARTNERNRRRIKAERAAGRDPRTIKAELRARDRRPASTAARPPSAPSTSSQSVYAADAIPADVPTLTLTTEGPTLWIAKALAGAGLVKSTSEGKRLVEQGGVEVDRVPRDGREPPARTRKDVPAEAWGRRIEGLRTWWSPRERPAGGAASDAGFHAPRRWVRRRFHRGEARRPRRSTAAPRPDHGSRAGRERRLAGRYLAARPHVPCGAAPRDRSLAPPRPRRRVHRAKRLRPALARGTHGGRVFASSERAAGRRSFTSSAGDRVPAKLESIFRAQTGGVDGRAVDREGEQAIVRAWGTMHGEPAQMATFGHEVAALEVGRFGPLRVAELFARERLKRASPALKSGPLARAAELVRDPGGHDAPARAFALGPFEGESAKALGGLIAASTAAALGAEPGHRRGRRLRSGSRSSSRAAGRTTRASPRTVWRPLSTPSLPPRWAASPASTTPSTSFTSSPFRTRCA